MRKPGNHRTQEDSFISGAESDKLPWERKLDKKYNKDTGKTINVRCLLPIPYRVRLYGEAEYQAKSWKGLDTRVIC